MASSLSLISAFATSSCRSLTYFLMLLPDFVLFCFVSCMKSCKLVDDIALSNKIKRFDQGVKKMKNLCVFYLKNL